MEHWQQTLENYRRTLNERLDRARHWKADMRRWSGQTQEAPVSEMELAFFEVDVEDSERVFDESFMDGFREVHQLVGC